MSVEMLLPENTLDVFPVQYFSQRELPVAQRLRAEREGTRGIFFADNFPGRRPAARDPTTGRPATAATTGHHAIDITAPRGVPIFAAKAGIVPASWWAHSPEAGRVVELPGRGSVDNPRNGDGGNYLILVDDDGRHHYYAHMNEVAGPQVGHRVEAGDLLGHVGNTGRAARGGVPHLHYAVTTRTRWGTRVFWNPYNELLRLAAVFNAIRFRASSRYNIGYDDFVAAAQEMSTPDVIHPWDVGFPTVGRGAGPSELSVGVVDPWAISQR